MKRQLMLLSCAFLLTGCTKGNPTNTDVKIYNADGDSLGTIKLEEQADGVMLKVKLDGLEPGVHGIHIHEKGSCKAPDFKSAGNHYNPDNKKHGLLNPKGAHAGDLPNLIADGSGKAKADLLAPNVTLKEGKATLFTQKGTSIVINAKKDNGMSQPAGKSGKRIGCGVIKKAK